MPWLGKGRITALVPKLKLGTDSIKRSNSFCSL